MKRTNTFLGFSLKLSLSILFILFLVGCGTNLQSAKTSGKFDTPWATHSDMKVPSPSNTGTAQSKSPANSNTSASSDSPQKPATNDKLNDMLKGIYNNNEIVELTGKVLSIGKTNDLDTIIMKPDNAGSDTLVVTYMEDPLKVSLSNDDTIKIIGVSKGNLPAPERFQTKYALGILGKSVLKLN